MSHTREAREMGAGRSHAESADARAILEALERIERRLDRVELLAEQASRDAKAGLAAAVDTFDGLVARMQASGIDLDERAKQVIAAADKLSSERAIALLEASLSRADAIRTVLESGVLDPAAVAIVSKAGRALAEAAAEPGQSVGPFGLMRAMGDGDVRAASGLLVRFARKLGRAIAPGNGPALPAESTTHAEDRS